VKQPDQPQPDPKELALAIGRDAIAVCIVKTLQDEIAKLPGEPAASAIAGALFSILEILHLVVKEEHKSPDTFIALMTSTATDFMADHESAAS
jgi:hypothetical protein